MTEAWRERLIEHEARYYQMAGNLERTDFALFLYGPEHPEYQDANHALRLRDNGQGADATAQAVIAYYRAKGQRVAADVDAIAEAQGIGAALRRRGVTPVIGDMRLLRFPETVPPPAPKSGLQIEIVPNETGKGEANAWVETVLQAHEGDADDPLWRGVAEAEARYPLCKLYLAWWEGKPVGSCSLFSADGWARIESVVTVPEFRRRGVASAIVTQAVTDSLTQGNTETYLYTEAGGAGEQVYRRLGFVPVALNIMRRHLSL